MASKYLIVDNVFLMSSSVEYHRELLPNKQYNTISGGGRFHIDEVNKRVILYDKSDDFGAATYENIISALNNTLLSFSLEGFEFYISTKIWISEALAECKERTECDFLFIY